MECKSTEAVHYPIPSTELIDTLWNVNEIIAELEQMVDRINRYIMECK